MISPLPKDKSNVKVVFELDVEEGFPPISAESLHGIIQPNGLVRLDNTPFFVEGVALGDIVACTGEGPIFLFDHIEVRSGNKALSVIFIDKTYSEELFQALRLQGLYCEFGEFPEYDMLAVSVPASMEYNPIRTMLEGAEDDRKISFAELCIS